jgi:hypothetical protein
MILADISGQLIFFIVFAAIGVINWWLEKKKTEAASQEPPPFRPQSPSTGGSEGDSEQERLRRFLEALGVPQPPAPPPVEQRRQPEPEAPPPEPRLRPVPRPAAQSMERRMQVPRPAAQVVRRPKPPVVIEPEEFQVGGRLEEAASSIERISGEFEQMNVRVAMPPVQPLETPAQLATTFAGTTSVLRREESPLTESVRALLRKPSDIRATFVAMEILGTPKGLQR